jgi:hypothetical protein
MAEKVANHSCGPESGKQHQEIQATNCAWMRSSVCDSALGLFISSCTVVLAPSPQQHLRYSNLCATWSDLGCTCLSIVVFPLEVSHCPAHPPPALRHLFQDHSPCDIFNPPRTRICLACWTSRQLLDHLANVLISSPSGETKKPPPPNTSHALLVTYFYTQHQSS